YVEPSATSFSDWLGDLMQSRAGLALLRTSGAGDLLLASRLHALQQAAPLRFVQTALERRGPARVTALAYCFCEPR
ncbi:MAG: hypothetical protein ACK40R_04385, partial [Thermomonas sp.]